MGCAPTLQFTRVAFGVCLHTRVDHIHSQRSPPLPYPFLFFLFCQSASANRSQISLFTEHFSQSLALKRRDTVSQSIWHWHWHWHWHREWAVEAMNAILSYTCFHSVAQLGSLDQRQIPLLTGSVSSFACSHPSRPVSCFQRGLGLKRCGNGRGELTASLSAPAPAPAPGL